MKPPVHSARAVAYYVAPDRAYYSNGADYALACLRCHERRIAFDTINQTEPA